MKKQKAIFTFLLILSSTIICQDRFEFIDSIDKGLLEYELHGNDNSTGAAVEGTIKNVGTEIIQVEVNLDKPLFLENNSVGQNLILFQIYYSNGKYLRDEFTTYLEFKPDTVYNIVGNVLCNNFEKPNPVETEKFTVKPLSDSLKAYDFIIKMKNPIIKRECKMKQAQCALWYIQGESLEKINTKFEIELDELEEVRELIDK
ncbi:MAG: hypothetical protein NTX22_10755 [Ignavibacteriales bacterium]|nr:hypothetical protein [Ignavibacteriales bacterium]